MHYYGQTILTYLLRLYIDIFNFPTLICLSNIFGLVKLYWDIGLLQLPPMVSCVDYNARDHFSNIWVDRLPIFLPAYQFFFFLLYDTTPWHPLSICRFLSSCPCSVHFHFSDRMLQNTSLTLVISLILVALHLSFHKWALLS